jgi:hypothetical protein
MTSLIAKIRKLLGIEKKPAVITPAESPQSPDAPVARET